MRIRLIIFQKGLWLIKIIIDRLGFRFLLKFRFFVSLSHSNPHFLIIRISIGILYLSCAHVINLISINGLLLLCRRSGLLSFDGHIVKHLYQVKIGVFNLAPFDPWLPSSVLGKQMRGDSARAKTLHRWGHLRYRLLPYRC